MLEETFEAGWGKMQWEERVSPHMNNFLAGTTEFLRLGLTILSEATKGPRLPSVSNNLEHTAYLLRLGLFRQLLATFDSWAILVKEGAWERSSILSRTCWEQGLIISVCSDLGPHFQHLAIDLPSQRLWYHHKKTHRRHQEINTWDLEGLKTPIPSPVIDSDTYAYIRERHNKKTPEAQKACLTSPGFLFKNSQDEPVNYKIRDWLYGLNKNDQLVFKNVWSLSQFLGREKEYTIIYEHCSDTIHGFLVPGQFHQSSPSEAHIVPLRAISSDKPHRAIIDLTWSSGMRSLSDFAIYHLGQYWAQQNILPFWRSYPAPPPLPVIQVE